MLKENPLDRIVRNNKSPGFCPKCNPSYYQLEECWGHKPKNCRNTLYCSYHSVEGHAPTRKCAQLCSYCRKRGHSMPFCHKLKYCDLCGQRGHNPYRCWTYNRIGSWLDRAREQDRCADCLRPWKPFIRENGDSNDYDCSYCRQGKRAKVYFPSQSPQETKESQTEDNIHLGQECQEELQQEKAIIENQKIQMEELSNKISALEIKLKSATASIKELNFQWQNTIQEKEELQAELSQKNLELKQHRETLNSQPSFSTLAASSSEHTGELKQMKVSLENLQTQQQQIVTIVNHLFYENRIKTLNSTNHLNGYPNFSFSPYVGLWDTGQYFNKLQQV